MPEAAARAARWDAESGKRHALAGRGRAPHLVPVPVVPVVILLLVPLQLGERRRDELLDVGLIRVEVLLHEAAALLERPPHDVV